MTYALEGVKVVDLSQGWAGPGGSMYLADQGADVIKIEPLSGDQARHFTTTPLTGDADRGFHVLNRNKRGIALSLGKGEGKEIVCRLIKRCDVLIHNFIPGEEDRVGLGYQQVKELNPGLIYVSLTPFGRRGPYAGQPAYDGIIQAMTGIMGHRTTSEGTPTSAGVWVADCSTPMMLAYAVTLALLVREKSGEGQRIDMALYNQGLAMSYPDLARNEKDAFIKKTDMDMYTAQAMNNAYRCQDGRHIFLIVATGEQWHRLCKAMDLEHLSDDPALDTHLKRVERSAELYPVLEAVFGTKPREEWARIFIEAGVPHGPVLSRDEVLSHPQAAENNMVAEVEHPLVGNMKMVGIPFTMSVSESSIRRPAPLLGQHTGEILGELGYGPEEIRSLHAGGVVKTVAVES